jgi:hypothetical protein
VRAFDEVVHPVEGAQERALAGTGRADDGRDPALADVQGHVLHCAEVAVPAREVVQPEHGLGLRLELGRERRARGHYFG